MWKTLVLQGLIFFLCFQPRLLARRRLRYLLVLFSVLVSLVVYRLTDMDPFAWLLYMCGIVLTYWTANKALRWIFVNRQFVEEESKRLARREEELREKTGVREGNIER